MTELEILNLVHQTFHGEAWLNYAMKYFSALAAGGTISIVLCVVLLIFKKTRRCGVALAFALIVDVVVVNLILNCRRKGEALDSRRAFLGGRFL